MKTCTQCGREKDDSEFYSVKGRWLESECKLCSGVRERRRNQALKAEVMAAYGGQCECCDEDELTFLAIDHVNDDGEAQRKAGLSSGINMYRWLKKNGYPEGYQILCHNCNHAKRMGPCPHKALELA